MYLICIPFCLAAFVIYSSNGEVDLPDSLEYSCIASSNGTTELNLITIQKKFLQNFEGIYAYKGNSIWAECNTSSNSSLFIILGCWNYDVIVAPRNNSYVIIGGKDSKLYQLKCIGPDRKNTNVTVDIEKSIKYAGSQNVFGMDTVNAYGFDMIILDHHNQPRDAYLIGDAMTMQIKPKEKFNGIQWRVLSCTAYSAPVEIKFVSESRVISDTRIAEAYNETADLYQIHLYAFHGVHNNEVTYTCTIEICWEEAHGTKCNGTTPTPTTKTTAQTTPNPTTITTTQTTPNPTTITTTQTTPNPGSAGRRRRSGDDYPNIQTAKQKIHVYDRTEDMPASGAFQSSLSMTMIYGASLLIWIYK